MKTLRRIGAPLAAATLIYSILSCASESTWPTVPHGQSSALETLQTLETSMSGPRRSLALGTYIGCFADSMQPGDLAYHHDFDPSDVTTCGCAAPASWTIANEASFYLRFRDLRPGDSYVATFDSVPSRPDPPVTGESTSLFRSYQVLAVGSDGSSARIIALGSADLIFHRLSGGRWVISRWNDHATPLNPSDPGQVSLGRRRLDSTL